MIGCVIYLDWNRTSSITTVLTFFHQALDWMFDTCTGKVELKIFYADRCKKIMMVQNFKIVLLIDSSQHRDFKLPRNLNAWFFHQGFTRKLQTCAGKNLLRIDFCETCSKPSVVPFFQWLLSILKNSMFKPFFLHFPRSGFLHHGLNRKFYASRS